MNIAELKVAEDKIREFADKLSQDEQKVLYNYLYHLGHRAYDSGMFVAEILRRGK